METLPSHTNKWCREIFWTRYANRIKLTCREGALTFQLLSLSHIFVKRFFFLSIEFNKVVSSFGKVNIEAWNSFRICHPAKDVKLPTTRHGTEEMLFSWLRFQGIDTLCNLNAYKFYCLGRLTQSQPNISAINSRRNCAKVHQKFISQRCEFSSV